MTMTADSCPQCGGAVPVTYGDRVACPYCGSSLVRIVSSSAGPAPPGMGDRRPDPTHPTQEVDSTREAAVTWGVRLRRAVLEDARTRLPVFEWLLPADWECDGTVTWRQSVAVPALVGFRAWNPTGAEQIECLPSIPNTWTESAVTAAFRRFQPRTLPFKLDGLEQRAPMTAREALRQLVVPRYRGRVAAEPGHASTAGRPGWPGRWGGAWSTGLRGLLPPPLVEQRVRQVPGLPAAIDYVKKLAAHGYPSRDVDVHVVEEETLPHLAASLREPAPDAGPAPASDGARVRLRYAFEGTTIEEDLFCVVSSVRTESGSGLLAEAHTHWVAESLFAFRADVGRLDAFARAAMASVRSIRMNAQWFAAYQAESQRIMQERIAMQQALQQMAAIQRASFQRQMHRLSDVSRTISETSDMVMAGYESRSASFDRMSEGWSQAMRGVDAYASPGGGSVELPGGYAHAWTNGLGEYVLTDSSFLNPGAFAPGTWEAMTRR